MTQQAGSTTSSVGARRATLLLAGASGVSFALNLARTKLLALTWGPAGIGQLGLMQAAMGTATLVTGLGVDGLVARDVAATPRGSEESNRAIAAATSGALVLATLSSLVSFAALALYLRDISLPSIAGAAVLGVGAGVSVLAANFRAVLAGLGEARTTAIASVAAATVGVLGGLILCVGWQTPTTAVLSLSVAMVPFTTMLGLAWFIRRHSAAVNHRTTSDSFRDLLRLARRASLFTIAGVLPILGQVLVRTIAARELTETGLGQLQAAAAITSLSTSLLASSIGPVVIPQLSTVLRERQSLSPVLGGHAEFLITLYAPIALAVAAMPAIVLSILYSGKFDGGAPQLAWQVTGEILRLPVWLMATSLVVLNRSRAYLVLELVGVLTQVVGVWWVVGQGDSAAIGLVFASSTLAQFVLATLLLRSSAFAWSARTLLHIGLIVGACALLASLKGSSVALALGAALVLLTATLAARQLWSLRRARSAEPHQPAQ